MGWRWSGYGVWYKRCRNRGEKVVRVRMVRWRAFGKGRKGTIGLDIEYVSLQQTITNHVGR
jgi:hypothetical protein